MPSLGHIESAAYGSGATTSDRDADANSGGVDGAIDDNSGDLPPSSTELPDNAATNDLQIPTASSTADSDDDNNNETAYASPTAAATIAELEQRQKKEEKKAAAAAKRLEQKAQRDEAKKAQLEYLKTCPLSSVTLNDDGTDVDSIGNVKWDIMSLEARLFYLEQRGIKYARVKKMN